MMTDSRCFLQQLALASCTILIRIFSPPLPWPMTLVWSLLTIDFTKTKPDGVSKQKQNQQQFWSYTMTLMFKGLRIGVCDVV